MKKLFLLPLLAISLIGCKQQKWDNALEHFCKFYNDDYISVYIETTTDHDVHELRTISRMLMAKSTFKRDEYNFLYAKLDVIYLSSDKFHELNWLVEYKYNDDYSYEQATNYSVVYVE